MSLNPRQRKALKVLQEGLTMKASAEAIGCSKRTLFNWLKDDEFLSQLRGQQDAAQAAALSLLIAASRRAVLTLIEIMDSELLPASTRLAASKTIIDESIKVREAIELERRVRDEERRRGNG